MTGRAVWTDGSRASVCCPLIIVNFRAPSCNGVLQPQAQDTGLRSNSRDRESGWVRSSAARLEQAMERIMKKLGMAISVVALALAASVSADPGGGYGMGAGCGAGTDGSGVNCPAADGGHGYGHGPGYGHGGGGHGGMGMSLLTRDEQIKFRDAMHEMKTVAECTAVVEQRQALIAARAKEKGIAAPASPRADMCERMKARGFIS